MPWKYSFRKSFFILNILPPFTWDFSATIFKNYFIYILKMTKYKMYLFNDNKIVGKYKTTTDDMNLIFTEFGEEIVRDGFKQKINIKTQIDMYKNFIEVIDKQKRHSEKIRHSDFYLYLSCFCALYKFNEETDDVLFLKCKKKKLKKVIN